MELAAEYVEVRIGGRREVVPLAGSEILVGRSADNGIVLADPSVSRLHASISRLGKRWVIRDLGSRNGCLVNGVRITGDRPLHDGDEIRVGEAFLTYRARQVAPALERTAPAGEAPDLTRREREILLAFARAPVSGALFRTPPSVRHVASSLHITEAAVKQHLSRLYDKFGIVDGGNRRAALLEEAVRLGAISLGEVGGDA
jgi:DNA-binding CsgD family transcriptional regulator